MKYIYFDHNVIIDLKNIRNQSIAETVKQLNRSRYQILISPAHIEEVAALKMHHGNDDDVVNSFLNFLAELTNSNCLLPFKINQTLQTKKSGIFLSQEHPQVTYTRVTQNYHRNIIAENHQKEKIANGESFEKENNISSKETNNIDIQNEISMFKPHLHQIIKENYASLKGTELKPYISSNIPTCEQINFAFLGEFFPLHEMTIEKIFEFLEARRYFPDKSTQFLSGLHDTTHAIYAAYCDVFVTSDKKLRKKTKATYTWLGINTLILNPSEFIEWLSLDNVSSNS